jgi:hypothetical protein
MSAENRLKLVKGTTGLMPVDELTVLFGQNYWVIETKQKISFELQMSGQVIATFTLKSNQQKGINIDLIVDYKDLESFIRAHKIKSVKDFELINSSNLWLRYLAGDGFVVCDIDSIDAEVCFRIVKSVTMVYSSDLSFYQEIAHAMSMTEQFAAYIETAMPRFIVAATMRPMLLPTGLYMP